MNELRNEWQTSEVLRSVFTTGDLLVAESLIRQARMAGCDWQPSEIEITSLLLLAKATRLEHVALPLGEEDLTEQLRRDLWSDDEQLVRLHPPAAEVVGVFQGQEHWHEALCEIVDIATDLPASGRPIVIAKNGASFEFAYLRRLAYAEDQVALELISSIASISEVYTKRGFTHEALLKSLMTAAPNLQTNEAVSQALRNLVTRRISVLTGGPGTGKTFTVAAFLAALQAEAIRGNQILKVARCAPTSKASVRLGEQIEAAFSELPKSETYGVTFDARSGSVQRLLRMHKNSSTANRELDVDLLIVDEVSMLDLGLLEQLLGAVQPHTHVLLVGDPNQLISVRVGAILRDIVELAAEDGPASAIVTKLEIAHRFGESINALAIAINAGDIAAVNGALETYSGDLSRVESADAVSDRVLDWARQLATASRMDDPSVGINALRSLSVLCGTRMGPGSVAWWTKKIQISLLVEGRLAPDQRVPTGAPIMVTKNELRAGFNDSEALSNGDLGLAMSNASGEQVVFGPSARPRVRRPSEIEHFELGWSLTIHKSQGSDYDEVIVSLPPAKSTFVSRELLYTAVTRAKAKVTIIGSLETIEAAIKIRANRIGGLKLRLARKLQAK